MDFLNCFQGSRFSSPSVSAAKSGATPTQRSTALSKFLTSAVMHILLKICVCGLKLECLAIFFLLPAFFIIIRGTLPAP